MGAGQCCPCSSVLIFMCSSLWVTLSPLPATPLSTLSVPFKGNCSAGAPSSLCLQREGLLVLWLALCCSVLLQVLLSFISQD